MPRKCFSSTELSGIPVAGLIPKLKFWMRQVRTIRSDVFAIGSPIQFRFPKRRFWVSGVVILLAISLESIGNLKYYVNYLTLNAHMVFPLTINDHEILIPIPKVMIFSALITSPELLRNLSGRNSSGFGHTDSSIFAL